ncbi:MAG TPA: hypothetical protein VKQ08_04780 [Cyclobacteriaceae bacterium]|nr:hypothetical protein [Cyclobacteriaceae bacterium]
MTPLENAQFANQLGHFYQSVAAQIGNYIHENIGTPGLSRPDLDILSDDQTRIISYANTFFSLSDKIAFADSDVSFGKITAAQEEIKNAVTHIDNSNKAIGIAGGVISLAAAVVTCNASGIATSLGSILAAAA